MSVDFRIVIETKEATRNLNNINNSVDQTSAKFKDLSGTLKNITGLLKDTAVAFGVGMGVSEFINQLVKMRGQLQDVEVTMTTLLNSAEKAQVLIGQMKKTAIETPFSFMDVAQGANQLLAYGIAAEEVNDTLKDLGDIAAGMGRNLGELIFLYGTTIRQQHMYTVDLRQFLGRGIPIGEYLAKQLGIAEDALQEAVRAGKVTSAVFDAAIKDMANSKFDDLMVKKSETISGRLEKIRDSIQLAFSDIGEDNEGTINWTLDALASVAAHFRTIGNVVIECAKAYGVYKTAVMVVTAYEKVSLAIAAAKRLAVIRHTKATMAQAAATVIASKAQKSLNLVMLKNPYVIAAMAIFTVVEALVSFKDKADDTTESMQEFGEEAGKILDKTQSLYFIVNTASKGSKTYKDALDKLTSTCQEYGIEIDKEGDKLEQVNKNRERLIDLIKEEGVERQYANTVSDIYSNYEEEVTKIQDEIKDKIDSGSKITDKTVAQLIRNQVESKAAELKSLKEAYGEALRRIYESKEDPAGPKEYSSEDYEKDVAAVNKYIAAMNKLVLNVEASAKANGINLSISEKSRKSIVLEAQKILEAVDAREKNIKSAEELYHANTQLVRSEGGVSQGMADSAYQAKLAAMSVNSLGKTIDSLLATYGYNVMTFKLQLDEEGMPQWMSDYLGLGKDQKVSQRNVDFGKKQAAFWARNLRSMKQKGVGRRYIKNSETGKYEAYTQEDAAKWAYYYASGTDMAEEKLSKQKPPKKPKKPNSTADKQAKANKTISDENKRWSETEAKNAQERAYAIEQARIDGMSEGSAKTLAQLELDHQKELDQIKKQEDELLKAKQEHAKKLFEANPKNKNKDFTKTQEYANIALTDEEKSGLEAQTKSANIKYDKEVDEVRKQDLDSMREYLKEYGTIQERRVALIQEWDEKIAKAQSEGERLTAVRQKSQAVKDFDNEQLKKSFDWEQMFGDIGNMSVEQLKAAKGQLKEKLSDGSLKVEDYKTIVEQIDKINDAIVEAQSGESVFFGLITEHAKERKKLEMEVAEAIDQQTAATLKLAQAQAGLDDSKANINDMLIGYGMQDQAKANFQDISAADAQPIIQAATAKFGAGSAEVRALQAALDTLTDSTQQVTEAQDKLATATGKVTDAQNKQESQKGWQKQLSAFQQKYEKYAQNIEALPELTSALGIDADSDVGRAVQGMADAASSAGQAMSDLASGNYVGAAANAMSALDSLTTGLGIGGDTDKALAEDIERMTEENQNLTMAIERLTDVMDDASYLKSQEIYEQQKEALAQQEKNTKEEMQRSAAVKDKTTWFHDGTPSSNYYIGKGMTAADWQKVSEAAGKSVSSGQDFFKLTSEEMYNVATKAAAQYEKIKGLANDGYKDAAQFMDEYIGYYETANELADSLKEKLTDISLDSVKSEMESMLQDLDSSFSDASDNIETYLRNAIVSAILSGDAYAEKMEDWYKDFSDAMSDEVLTDDEAERLKQEYLEIYGAERDKVNAALEAAGLDSVASGQSASYGESSSITQDQASEISGRLTAMQWSGEQRLAIQNIISQNTASLVTLQTAGNSFLSEIRTMMFSSTNYLADIQADTRKIYNEWTGKLDKMQKSLEKL